MRKASKLTRRKKTKNKNVASNDTSETILSQMMENQTIQSTSTTTMEGNQTQPQENIESELQKVQEENQYLKLLLGMSYKLDQLYEIWTGHFPNAFSNETALKTFLELHSKQKQSELILKTFRHVETIKSFISEHKSQMLGAHVTTGSRDMSSVSASGQVSGVANVAMMTTPLASDNESAPSVNVNTLSMTTPNLNETSITSKQRKDLGRMLSKQVSFRFYQIKI